MDVGNEFHHLIRQNNSGHKSKSEFHSDLMLQLMSIHTNGWDVGALCAMYIRFRLLYIRVSNPFGRLSKTNEMSRINSGTAASPHPVFK
jgi:hypothetical protein